MFGNAKNTKERNLLLIAIILTIMIAVFYFFIIHNTEVVAENNIDILIDYIPAKEVVCVGKIKLEKNVDYVIDISVESGDTIFVALNTSDDIVNAQGVKWKQYFEITGKKLEHTFTDIETGDFYVYVGNKSMPLEIVKGELISVR